MPLSSFTTASPSCAFLVPDARNAEFIALYFTETVIVLSVKLFIFAFAELTPAAVLSTAVRVIFASLPLNSFIRVPADELSRAICASAFSSALISPDASPVILTERLAASAIAIPPLRKTFSDVRFYEIPSPAPTRPKVRTEPRDFACPLRQAADGGILKAEDICPSAHHRRLTLLFF